jgi:lipopolysaccharide transport system permease protein
MPDAPEITDFPIEGTSNPVSGNSVSTPEGLPETVIEARSAWKFLDVYELWRYRELLFFLAWRDVKVRYKQTVLGAAWAILQPVLLMVVFSLFLGRLAGLATGGFSYPVFVYAGLLPWTLFATAVSSAGNSVIDSERLITKVYFPRLAIPFAAAGAALVDFAIAFLVLVLLIVYEGIALTWAVLLIPGLVILITLAALGVGTLLAALNVAYRDFRYVLPFLIQLWMFATPAIYMQSTAAPAATVPGSAVTDKAEAGAAAEAIPPATQRFLNLNPMNGLIAFFRAATFGQALPWAELGFSSLMVFVFLFVGCCYFNRVEDSFADII